MRQEMLSLPFQVCRITSTLTHTHYTPCSLSVTLIPVLVLKCALAGVCSCAMCVHLSSHPSWPSPSRLHMYSLVLMYVEFQPIPLNVIPFVVFPHECSLPVLCRLVPASALALVNDDLFLHLASPLWLPPLMSWTLVNMWPIP
jgi:hypothetical protein